MMGPFSRILARYLAAALVTWGLLDPSLAREFGADEDFAFLIQTALGGLVMVATEAWYWIAKRLGWST